MQRAAVTARERMFHMKRSRPLSSSIGSLPTRALIVGCQISMLVFKLSIGRFDSLESI